jgi:molybdate transport system substrate-binding protein
VYSWGNRGVLLSAGLALGACRDGAAPTPLRIAAAADLSSAFPAVGAAYEKRTGTSVVFAFGATGLLERQIAEGAPFDAFAAADVSFADDAVRAGACLADSRQVYAIGHIVLFTRRGAAFRPAALEDLTDPRVKTLAIANPGHAPYGRAAKQALERAGLWDRLRDKLVYGENVLQALQFAQSGNADAAIIALSLAITAEGDWTAVPASLHEPLEQAFVVCSHGKAGVAAARRFAGFLQSDECHAILRRYGFLLPGEPTSAVMPANPMR